jgi:hypothetical protein
LEYQVLQKRRWQQPMLQVRRSSFLDDSRFDR